MWADGYVGLPFVNRGRDRAGVDCWGLVRLVYADLRGVALPLWDTIGPDEPKAASRAVKAATGQREWQPVALADARPFDFLLMRGVPIHIGLLAPGNMVLHAEEGAGVVLQPLAALRHRITDVYRLEN